MRGGCGKRAGPVAALLPWALVLAATVVLARPLLEHRPALPAGDDVPFAVQSTRAVADAFREGVAIPRWVGEANRGLGAPTFLFYPPLAYYAAGLVSLARGDALAGLRWTAVLAGLLSGATFVLAFRGRGSAAAVGAGAALYVLAPYHLLDLYWRFAFAEYVAFLWLPLLFLFARRTIEGSGTAGVAGLGLAFAGLTLTHVVTAFLAPLLLLPYAGVRVARTRRPRRLVALAAAGVLGVTLAGFYLLPFGVQRHRVRLEWAGETPFGDYRRNFLLRDEAALGYPPAPIKPHVRRAAAAQGLLALVAFGLGLARRGSREREGRDARGEALAYGAVSALALLLQLSLSAPLWRVLPGLELVQFPWRFQTFQAFSACALVALAGGGLRDRGAGGLRPGWPAALLALAALPTLYLATRPIPAERFTFGPAQADTARARQAERIEYLPRGASVERLRAVRRVAPAERVRLAGRGRVAVERWTDHERVLRLRTDEAARLRVQTFVYPGWSARVDGRRLPIRPKGPVASMEIPVPSGRSVLHLRFERTSDRWAGLALSGAALAVAAVLALRSRRRSAPLGRTPQSM